MATQRAEYQIRNKATNTYLSDSGRVVVCNRFDEGAENQEWIIEEVPSARRDWSRPEGAVYNIINKSTGRRLGAQAANGPSPLQTASREFHWRIKPQTSLGGPCWLKPEGNSFCAELVAYNSGAPVGLRFEDYSDMQQWYFERIGPYSYPVAEGKYHISSAGTELVMDVPSPLVRDQPVILREKSQSNTQIWHISKAHLGYHIRNTETGTFLNLRRTLLTGNPRDGMDITQGAEPFVWTILPDHSYDYNPERPGGSDKNDHWLFWAFPRRTERFLIEPSSEVEANVQLISKQGFDSTRTIDQNWSKEASNPETWDLIPA